MDSLLHGDCREVLAGTEDEFDFVFADPPFNINHHYKDFDDNFGSWEEHFEFTWRSCTTWSRSRLRNVPAHRCRPRDASNRMAQLALPIRTMQP
jgi:DNA modification methylase